MKSSSPVQQMLFLGQPGENLLGLRFEPLDEREDRVAPRHVHRSELAGSVIDLSEQPAVDSAKVGQVVVAEINAFGEEHDLGGPHEPGLRLWSTAASVIPSRLRRTPVRGST